MKALIVVDVQNDFLPGGALAVPDGDAVIGPANRLMTQFPLVVATQDWHPANHGSFAVNHPGRKVYEEIDLNGLKQTLWPVHCVQNTPGAALAAALDHKRISRVVQKGTDSRTDSYSGFFDNARRHATGLHEYLVSQDVDEIFVCGLATEYCVKFTALDAVSLGYRGHLVTEACRGVNVRPGDVDRALTEMSAAGVSM